MEHSSVLDFFSLCYCRIAQERRGIMQLFVLFVLSVLMCGWDFRWPSITASTLPFCVVYINLSVASHSPLASLALVV